MKKINLIILGTGGSSRDIVDIIRDLNVLQQQDIHIKGFLDDDPLKRTQKISGLNVLGGLNDWKKFKNCMFINGIGSPSNFLNKKSLLSQLNIPLSRFVTLVHPTASVAATAKMGSGVVIYPNVTVSSNAQISDQVIILSNSVISHDVIIDSFTCIAGGVSISGSTIVGESCYLGTNSSLRGSIKIGNEVLIGMGSVVLNDVQENSVIVGNPARYLRNTK